MMKQLPLIVLCCLLFLGIQVPLHAASYYWRATAINNLFTNLGNWETAPGGGVSPSVAPTVADDVFFPVTSTQSSIVFNNGNCRNFTVTAPTAFTFTGTMTAIAGNLSCNGNATIGTSAGTIINFTGSGARTIDMGTTANKLFATLNFVTSTGSYTLSGPLNSYGYITVSGPSFSTNGNSFTFASFDASGATAKTIDFSNSLVTCIRNNTSGPSSGANFTSSGATTTYNMTGTRLVIQNDYIGGNDVITTLSLGVNVTLSLDSLTLGSATTGINKHVISLGGSSTLPATITANVLKINTGNINLGGFGTGLIAVNNFGVLNIGKLVYAAPNILYNNITTTLNIGAGGIVEPNGCGKAVIMNNTGTFTHNATPAITTTNTDYYNVTFGGGGITAGSNSNIGLNTGTATWTAAAAGISYWWVGSTGNWNDPTKWSITGSGGVAQSAAGCLPTLQDDVFFDANSFTGSQTVTIPNGGDAYCKNLNWSAGSNQGLLSGAAASYPGNLIINGNADFSKARGVTAPLLFMGSGSHTLTSGTFFTYLSPYIRFQGSGTYTLADNLLTTSAFIQHRAGTLNTAGFQIDGSNFYSNSLPQVTANARSLTITNSEFNLTNDLYVDASLLTVLNAAGSIVKSTSTSPVYTVTRSNSAVPFLNTINLYNLSAIAALGTATLNTSGTAYTVNFNDVSFAGDAAINNIGGITHNVNNYNFSSGKTYVFQTGGVRIYNVLNAINTSASGCADLLLINSSIAGTQALINKATGPFTVNGAVVKDINAMGAAMTITSGVDNGNNTNVVVGASTGRTMYWVGNTGNWSDGANHWSINASGGNPAVTNSLGCVPRLIDSVVFDANSFTLNTQIVTLDVTANCKGMMWTAGAGAKAPKMAGLAAIDLNNYGCLELGAGMTMTYNGTIHLLGTNTAANSNYIDMNGVTIPNSISLEGGGTYDLVDSVTMNGGRLTLVTGNIFAHSNKITAGGFTANIKSGFAGDISNCLITLTTGANAYLLTHAAGSTWNAAGSTIYSNGSVNIANNTGSPINYRHLIMTGNVGTLIVASATNVVNFSKIQYTNTSGSFTTTLNGIIVTDTLQYAPQTTNLLTPGGLKTYTVNDTLIAYGTPCTPSYLRSATLGTQAILKSTRCNFDLNFVSIRDINVTTCTAAQNKDKGADEGNNTNWTITSVAALTNLGPDTTITCKYTPFTQSTTGFGVAPGMTYLWGGGETTNTLTVTTSGIYSIAVTYAVGCSLNDTRTITVTQTPPAILSAANAQASTSSCNFGGYDYYEGAVGTGTFNKSIMAIKANGNVMAATTVTVNNQGNLTGTGAGTFSNSGTGYYQSTDGSTNTTRVSKRLQSVVCPGSYTANGGVIVRVYYTAADTAAMLTDAMPGAAAIVYKGWFKSAKHTAQEVLNTMTPGYLAASAPVTPIGYGTENGIPYAEFQVSSFSTFGFMATTTSTPLPITLLSFEATRHGSSSWLSWRTATEQNMDYFGIEHSTDSKTWAPLTSLSAKGSNSSYGYTHSNPAPGMNFYRLRMADRDGSLAYSPVRSMDFSVAGSDDNYQVYPNPAQHTVHIKGLTGTEQVKVYDMLGRFLKNAAVTGTEAQASLEGLPDATYNVVITGGITGTHTFKIIKQD